MFDRRKLMFITQSSEAVLALFLFAFRRFGPLIYAFVPLSTGLILTFGFTYVVFGELNAATDNPLFFPGAREADYGPWEHSFRNNSPPGDDGAGRLDAAEACRIGLVNTVFPQEEFADAVMIVAKALAHGHRLELLELLAQSERSVEALADLYTFEYLYLTQNSSRSFKGLGYYLDLISAGISSMVISSRANRVARWITFLSSRMLPGQ